MYEKVKDITKELEINIAKVGAIKKINMEETGKVQNEKQYRSKIKKRDGR